MSVQEQFDEQAVVAAYLDAQRPAYPHEDFRTFRRAKLTALEAAYGIELSHRGVTSGPSTSLWMLFQATAESFLNLGGPRAGFLEDSLINTTLERADNPQLALRETEARLHKHLRQAREAHLELLVGLFKALWGPIEKPCTVSDLVAFGFDPSTEPKMQDYFEFM